MVSGIKSKLKSSLKLLRLIQIVRKASVIAKKIKPRLSLHQKFKPIIQNGNLEK
jgi:hypothetical protein